MRLTLDALIVLDAIERKGSFAAAAAELHRVPSAITYAVQKLEEELGILIFDRSGHRAQLTNAGRELVREGRRLLDAAGELEARAQRIATGYEVELRIAVDDVIPIDRLYPLCQEFYASQSGTRLRLASEVFGGTWDALATHRADLIIGAPADGPIGGYATRPLGTLRFVFMVAPTHPLASQPEPLGTDAIMHHRAVAAADSSRSLAPRTSGLISGQDVFTVPSMRAKIAAQAAGLGVGHIPAHLAPIEEAAGRLVRRRVTEPQPDMALSIAWRNAHRGKALEWFVQRLDDPSLRAQLLRDAAS